MNRNVLEKIENHSYENTLDNAPTHDYYHILRVRAIALYIAKKFSKCDIFLVEVLALLYDVEDDKLNPPLENTIEGFLSSIDIHKIYKNKILYLLKFMSFSKNPIPPTNFTIKG